MNYRPVKSFAYICMLGVIFIGFTQGASVTAAQGTTGKVTGVLASKVKGNIQIADAGKEPDYTSQQAWKGGMQSGEGNFMANCVTCHGPQGKGDGVLADSLDVKPRDLSNKAIISARTDKYLFNVIKNGGASIGLSESMTPWGTTFSDVEINNLVKHIRTAICKCKYTGNK